MGLNEIFTAQKTEEDLQSLHRGSLRPQPLEQWLWRKDVPPSAERVFWLHWQERMRNRDWWSCIALKHVASQCSLGV